MAVPGTATFVHPVSECRYDDGMNVSTDSSSDNPSKIGWQTGLVVLPFAHLLMASTYLYAYCFGFGANLSTFVSASDIFTTSIRNLAPVYAIAAGFIFLSSGGRLIHWLTSIAHIEEQYGPPRHMKFDSPVSNAIKIFAVGFTVLWVGTSYASGKAIDVTYIMTGGLAFMLVENVLFNTRQARDVTVVLFAIAVIAGTIAFALHSGQRDRHAKFASQSASNSACGDYVVLRRFSETYLAIGRDNRHRLIDDECKVRFEVPAVKPLIPDRDMVPVVFRWLF